MTADVEAAQHAPSRKAASRRQVIYRHAFLVRLTHWLNALAIVFMIGTGLNIFNAHPRLYWGARGDQYDQALVSIGAHATPLGVRGVTRVGPVAVDTTGVLGWSRERGQWTPRAWPSWITIPSYKDLADARRWHFLVAWLLVGNGLVYGLWALASGHGRRDLLPTPGDLKSIPRSIIDHIRLKHPVGEAAKRYNVLQRLAYLGVIGLIGGMVATGLAMSPGVDAAAPWLPDLFGGRQSARTLHFAFASLIVLFVTVHLTEVMLAGPLNEIRSMITGRYAVPPEHD